MKWCFHDLQYACDDGIVVNDENNEVSGLQILETPQSPHSHPSTSRDDCSHSNYSAMNILQLGGTPPYWRNWLCSSVNHSDINSVDGYWDPS